MAAVKKQHFVKSANGHFKLVTLKDGADEEAYILAKAANGITILRCKSQPPSIKTLERYSEEGVALATDGCRVEPDGTCEHGHPSWLVAMNYM